MQDLAAAEHSESAGWPPTRATQLQGHNNTEKHSAKDGMSKQRKLLGCEYALLTQELLLDYTPRWLVMGTFLVVSG